MTGAGRGGGRGGFLLGLRTGRAAGLLRRREMQAAQLGCYWQGCRAWPAARGWARREHRPETGRIWRRPARWAPATHPIGPGVFGWPRFCRQYLRAHWQAPVATAQSLCDAFERQPVCRVPRAPCPAPLSPTFSVTNLGARRSTAVPPGASLRSSNQPAHRAASARRGRRCSAYALLVEASPRSRSHRTSSFPPEYRERAAAAPRCHRRYTSAAPGAAT